MKLLLDTCAFFWLAGEPAKLSREAAAAIDDPANTIYLSYVTLWEIVLKNSAGKLPLPGAPRLWVPEQIRFFGLTIVDLSPEAIFRSGELPRVHNDPFDRLLAATAIIEDCTVISPDPPFRALGARTIW